MLLLYCMPSYTKRRNEVPIVGRVMVIAPHPDDDVLGCGGSLLKHVTDGAHCAIVYMTSGEAGGGKKSPEALAAQREAEALNGAKKLGVTDLIFLHEPDGKLQISELVIEKVRTVIESAQPDLVYVPHEVDGHKDHRATYSIVIEAIKRLGYKPLIMAYEVWTPLQTVTHLVSFDEKTMQDKLSALAEHKSQVNTINFIDAISSLNKYRGILLVRSEYAECFRNIDLKND